MHPILVRAPATGASLAALVVAVALGAGVAGAAPRQPVGPASAGPARHVVLIGVPGLRWTDVSAAATPALWRLARHGSVGSLSVTGVGPRSCPADGWLTLNAGARAAAPRTAAGSCAPLPAVTEVRYAGGTGPGGARRVVLAPAQVQQMPGIVSSNQAYNENPAWGLLRSAAGPRGCTNAVGLGAALALASRSGLVGSFAPDPAHLTQADAARCPLTVIDLGALGPGPDPATGGQARAARVRADDREIGRITAALPASTMAVVAGISDDAAPHLGLLVVNGPGFRSGLLISPSTRQPGLALLLDLPVSVLHWLGRPVPSGPVGQLLHRASRSGLPAAVAGLIGQDTAAQVYRATMSRFFLIVGFGYVALFALIAVFPWGRGPVRGRRRRAVARAAGVWAAAVPAGSFLASLVPWWTRPHPAVLLYTMTVAWALAIAAAALTGPWRRDPLGPPGLVAAVTLGTIALDVMTGSHLQMETPFGLSALVGGRFYGLGNNAVEIYAASGLLLAAWLGGVVLRRGGAGLSRDAVLNRAAALRRTLLVMAAVAVFTVVAAGWPGFGAKVGGTVAMVPGFLVLLAGAAGVRITVRRGLLIAVSGLAVVVVFAVVSYALPGAGHSDIGAFVGQVLHGGASGTLTRKFHSNLGSLTESLWVLLIPVVLATTGTAVVWPGRVRAGLLVRGYQAVPLLRPVLGAIWLTGVLGWVAEDSGVTVPAAEFPFVLPLVIVILSSLPPRPAAVRPVAPAGEDERRAASTAADPGYL